MMKGHLSSLREAFSWYCCGLQQLGHGQKSPYQHLTEEGELQPCPEGQAFSAKPEDPVQDYQLETGKKRQRQNLAYLSFCLLEAH